MMINAICSQSSTERSNLFRFSPRPWHLPLARRKPKNLTPLCSAWPQIRSQSRVLGFRRANGFATSGRSHGRGEKRKKLLLSLEDWLYIALIIIKVYGYMNNHRQLKASFCVFLLGHVYRHALVRIHKISLSSVAIAHGLGHNHGLNP